MFDDLTVVSGHMIIRASSRENQKQTEVRVHGESDHLFSEADVYGAQ
jgi:hypothetical protein